MVSQPSQRNTAFIHVLFWVANTRTCLKQDATVKRIVKTDEVDLLSFVWSSRYVSCVYERWHCMIVFNRHCCDGRLCCMGRDDSVNSWTATQSTAYDAMLLTVARHSYEFTLQASRVHVSTPYHITTYVETAGVEGAYVMFSFGSLRDSCSTLDHSQSYHGCSACPASDFLRLLMACPSTIQYV